MKMLLLAGLAATSALAAEIPSTPDWHKVAEQALPAIVRVEANGERPGKTMDDPLFGDLQTAPRSVSAAGTGFVLDPNGYVLTAGSISEHADRFTISMQNGKRYDASKVGRDELLDITLLKVDGVTGWPTLKFASSSTLRMADPVATIGHAFELDAALTVGIVSAVRQHMPKFSWLPYIQTSVLIERGYAGSPLLNDKGNVVGIFSAIFGSNDRFSGISLAVPGDLIQQALPQLKANGVVHRPQIGLHGKEIWQPTEAPPHQQHLALVVDAVEANSPAAIAGLKPEDVITAFADQQVRDFSDLAMRIALSTAGTPYSLSIVRDGKPVSLSITPTIAQGAAEQSR